MNNKQKYRYFAFGLEISSSIKIPEFLTGNIKQEEDITIEYAQTPFQLINPAFTGVRFQASPGEFLLKVDNIANYLVKAGKSILIDPCKNAPENDIRLFLLGSAFGALIHQRGLLPFHGSAIVYKNKAIIFSGISGTGKSSLAASLCKQGFVLLADDICTISINTNNYPIVHPGYPQMKLWADTIEKLGENKSNFKKVRDGIKKYTFPTDNNFGKYPLDLGGVYILTTKNTERFNIETIKGIEKFNALKNNTYRLNFLKGTGTTASHFQHVELISRHCFVKRIERPAKGFKLAELTKLIMDDLSSIL